MTWSRETFLNDINSIIPTEYFLLKTLQKYKCNKISLILYVHSLAIIIGNNFWNLKNKQILKLFLLHLNDFRKYPNYITFNVMRFIIIIFIL